MVEELAPVGDRVLDGGDALLEHAEGRVGLELRVVLGHREQPAQGALDLLVDRPLLLDGASPLVGGARLRDALQDLPLVGHVALDRLDELGKLVVALLQQHVDVGPRLVDGVFEADQPVVDADAVEHGADPGEREHAQHDPAHDQILPRTPSCLSSRARHTRASAAPPKIPRAVRRARERTTEASSPSHT